MRVVRSVWISGRARLQPCWQSRLKMAFSTALAVCDRLRSCFSDKVFSPPTQEAGYRASHRFQQDPIFASESIFAIALDTKHSEFS